MAHRAAAGLVARITADEESPTMGRSTTINRTPTGGTNTFWEYVNDEATDQYRGTCCGQAAALTLAAFHGRAPKDRTSKSLRDLIKAHPPDALGGCAGTSWQRLRYDILEKKYRMRVTVDTGETKMRDWIRKGYPVLVMQDVARIGWGGLLGGHWTVVVGYDHGYYLLSNWMQPGYQNYGVVSVDTFNQGWDTWLTWAGGMSGKKFMVAYP